MSQLWFWNTGSKTEQIYLVLNWSNISCFEIIHDHVLGWSQHQLWLQTEHLYNDIQMIYVKIINKVTINNSKTIKKFINISLKNIRVNMNNAGPFSPFLDTNLCFYHGKSNQHIKWPIPLESYDWDNYIEPRFLGSLLSNYGTRVFSTLWPLFDAYLAMPLMLVWLELVCLSRWWAEEMCWSETNRRKTLDLKVGLFRSGSMNCQKSSSTNLYF